VLVAFVNAAILRGYDFGRIEINVAWQARWSSNASGIDVTCKFVATGRTARVRTRKRGSRSTINRRRFIGMAGAAALAGTTLGMGKRQGQALETTPAMAEGQRANVMLVMCDDLNLPTVEALDGLNRIFGSKGMEFVNGFVTTPICSPARASFLRGQYAHTHGLWNNQNPDGNAYESLRNKGLDDSGTLPLWLKDAGYRTGLAGKYINFYSGDRVPPGWDDWFGWMGGSESERVCDNGTVVNVGDRVSADLCAERGAAFVRRAAADGVPFFLQLSPHAPHNPPEVPYRHRDRFGNLKLPKGPNFNEADTADKPAWLRRYDPLTEDDVRRLVEVHRNRTRSMLPVVEMADRVIAALAETGQLERTYIFFVSDNGYHLGNHRMPRGKLAPYDEDTRVPYYVRGPGIAPGSKEARFALNTDFAPTVCEIAGATPTHDPDGASLLPLMLGRPDVPWRERFVIEARREKNLDPQVPNYQGVRGAQYQYVEYATGEKEAYNVRKDPDQLHRIKGDAAVYDSMAPVLAAMRDKSGAAVRAEEGF
jgi:arylsulfatase A-like enzyme